MIAAQQARSGMVRSGSPLARVRQEQGSTRRRRRGGRLQRAATPVVTWIADGEAPDRLDLANGIFLTGG